MQVILKGAHRDLEEAEQRGDHGEEDGQEEAEADDPAARQFLKDVRHDIEHKTGACGLDVHAAGKGGGNDDEAGQDRGGRVKDGDHDCVALQVVLLGDVGAQGHIEAPADAHGEQHLRRCLGEGGETELAEIRKQVILHALDGVLIYKEGPDAADDEQGKEERQHDLGDLLHNVGDAEIQKHRDEQKEDHGPDDGLYGRGGEAVEIGLLVSAEVAACEILERVLGDPAAHDDVVHVDHQGTDVGHPACESPFLTDALEGCDCILAGVAADGGLHLHHGMPDQGNDDDVDDKEDATASLVGEIREAPDISEADGRARRHHQIAEPGSPLTSFSICLITHSIILSCRADMSDFLLYMCAAPLICRR